MLLIWSPARGAHLDAYSSIGLGYMKRSPHGYKGEQKNPTMLDHPSLDLIATKFSSLLTGDFFEIQSNNQQYCQQKLSIQS